jgi:hypothetical protein
MALNYPIIRTTLVLVASIVIAASITITFRWEIVPTRDGTARLDRWSGEIVECRYDALKATQQPFAGHTYDCDPNEVLSNTSASQHFESSTCLSTEERAAILRAGKLSWDVEEFNCRMRKKNQ